MFFGLLAKLPCSSQSHAYLIFMLISSIHRNTILTVVQYTQGGNIETRFLTLSIPRVFNLNVKANSYTTCKASKLYCNTLLALEVAVAVVY